MNVILLPMPVPHEGKRNFVLQEVLQNVLLQKTTLVPLNYELHFIYKGPFGRAISRVVKMYKFTLFKRSPTTTAEHFL